MADDDLLLRPCVAADAPHLAEMYAFEPGYAPSFVEAAGQLDRITRVWPESQSLGFVAVEDGQTVGLSVLEDITGASATIGYYVASTHRGRGVATRALARLVDIAFHEVGLRRLVADIRPDNIASLHVAHRNAFRDEGPIEIDGVEHRRWVLDAEFAGR